MFVAGRTSAGHFGVARLSTLGKLDAGFGNSGLASASFGGSDHADQILIGNGGEMFAIGTSTSAGVTSTTIAAFDLAGNPILDFGNSGQLVISPNAGVVQRELHVSNLVLNAFGVMQNGKLVVVSSTPSAATPSTVTGTTSLRRILVAPQVDPSPSTSTQAFGNVGGKQKTAVFTLADGAKATFTLSGGAATAMMVGNRVRLAVNASSSGAALAVRVVGGGGRVTLDNLTINGSLRAFRARAPIWPARSTRMARSGPSPWAGSWGRSLRARGRSARSSPHP